MLTTPSAKMTKGYTDMLLSFQIFLIARAKILYFVIFSVSVLGRLWVNGTAIFVLYFYVTVILLLLNHLKSEN